jgi:AcrR family transcriptional regulator
MPRRKEEFAKIREQSRSHILQVALTLFADHGFDGTSMAMIAKKAGISVGLAYNYFKSKDDLLKELFTSTLENFSSAIGQQIERPSRQDCINLMSNLASSAKMQTDLWRLMMQIMLQPELSRHLMSGLQSMTSNPLTTFQRYFEEQKIAKPDLTAEAVLAIILGIVFYYLTHDDEKTMCYALDMISKKLL